MDVVQAAAMGVLKLYLISPEAVDDNNFDTSLYEMLRRDADGGVVGAALNALVEIKGGHGKASTTHPPKSCVF